MNQPAQSTLSEDFAESEGNPSWTARRNSGRNSRRIFEQAPIGIFQSTTDRLVDANPALASMFGFDSAEEMLVSAREASSFFANPEQRREIICDVLSTEGYIQEDVHYLRKDGSTFIGHLRMRAVRDEAGEIEFLEGFVEDITEQKRLEREVAMREQRLNSFFTNASAGLCILDSELRYVQINENLARINGQPVDRHIGKPIGRILPGLAPVLEPLLRKILTTGESVLDLQVSGETPGEPGVTRHWIVSYFPLPGKDGKPAAVGSVVVEVTEQKRVEESLRESEENFRQLTENIKSVFWMCSREMNRTIYVSPTYEQVWGRTCQSLYEHPSSFTEAIHPDDRDRVLASLKRQQSGEKYEEEYRITRPDGTLRWIHDRGFAVQNEQGEFYRMAGVAEDVTERRHLEERLQQAQKMEAVGQLAGGVAHDFNNILAATLMHLGLLQQSPQLTGGMKESLKEVEGEIMRGANLSRQLLLFSRRQIPKVEPLDLNILIHGLLKMLRRLLGENIEMSFHGAAEAVIVSGDAGMVEQVVMNLCINSRDAMPKGGTLQLETAMIEIASTSPKSHPDARPGRFACLSVIDSGCGMDKAVLQRVFEPFFTTKEPGKGTGLGLATVFGIVKQHQGWIEVESESGRGSAFRIYLPACPMPQVAAPRGAGLENLKGGSETILLVEDEVALRRTAALCLRKLGYAVLEAGNGPEALQVWQQHRDRIDLLFTDMIMPRKLTGADLAEQLVRNQGAIKVIISSGYSPEQTGVRSKTMREATYLPKPYQAQDLAEAVRRCLDANHFTPADACGGLPPL